MAASVKVKVKKTRKNPDSFIPNNSGIDELRLSYTDTIFLISKAVQIGYEKGREDSGEKSKYLSQNKVYKKYGRYRVDGWVDAGLLQRKTNGGGKSSTVLYDTSRCEELDLSETIVIRKPYKK